MRIRALPPPVPTPPFAFGPGLAVTPQTPGSGGTALRVTDESSARQRSPQRCRRRVEVISLVSICLGRFRKEPPLFHFLAAKSSTLVILLGMLSLLLAGLALPSSLPVQNPTDEEVVAVWEQLSAEDQKQISMWFQAEAERLDTYQNSLIKWIKGGLGHDPHHWPMAEPAPLYDAARHCPAQPIKRKYLNAKSSTARKGLERFFDDVPARPLDPAYVYDWGRRHVVQVADRQDPERLFRNGLAGFPPDLDLAEALVIAALDDGSQEELQKAFSHGYANRSGSAFPGVTLYDAWASGQELEMPDVECLGVVHDLLDDWKRWVAPVSEIGQRSLYKLIGQEFTKAQRYRGLRTAMGRTWLTGSAVMRDGYGGNLRNFHALWDKHEATPGPLAKELPSPKKWERWLKSWNGRVKRSKKLREAGDNRHLMLIQDADRVRRTLVGIMIEYGAIK